MRFQNPSDENQGHRPLFDRKILQSMFSKSVVTTTRPFHVAICVCLLCFVSWGLLSSNPLAAIRHSPLEFVRTISDVLMHCGVYAVFSLACFSFAVRTGDPRIKNLILFGLVVHGICTELVQAFIPARTCDPLDTMANMVGIAIGVATTNFVLARISGRSEDRWEEARQNIEHGNATVSG